eukprot:41932-Prymnesium_polylepis.1
MCSAARNAQGTMGPAAPATSITLPSSAGWWALPTNRNRVLWPSPFRSIQLEVPPAAAERVVSTSPPVITSETQPVSRA